MVRGLHLRSTVVLADDFDAATLPLGEPSRAIPIRELMLASSLSTTRSVHEPIISATAYNIVVLAQRRAGTPAVSPLLFSVVLVGQFFM